MTSMSRAMLTVNGQQADLVVKETEQRGVDLTYLCL